MQLSVDSAAWMKSAIMHHFNSKVQNKPVENITKSRTGPSPISARSSVWWD